MIVYDKNYEETIFASLRYGRPVMKFASVSGFCGPDRAYTEMATSSRTTTFAKVRKSS